MHDFIHGDLTVDGKVFQMKSLIYLDQDGTYTYTKVADLDVATLQEEGATPVLALFVRNGEPSWTKDPQIRATVTANVARVRVDVSGDKMTVMDSRAISDDSLILPYFLGKDGHEHALYARDSGQALFTKPQLDALCDASVNVSDAGTGAPPWFT